MNHYPSILIQETYLFSGRLAHKSGRNLSNKVRFSLVGMYHDVNSKHFKFKIKFIFKTYHQKNILKSTKKNGNEFKFKNSKKNVKRLG